MTNLKVPETFVPEDSKNKLEELLTKKETTTKPEGLKRCVSESPMEIMGCEYYREKRQCSYQKGCQYYHKGYLEK